MKVNYWLLKSEPSTWSWDDQVKAGIEMWDGVRNYHDLSFKPNPRLTIK